MGERERTTRTMSATEVRRGWSQTLDTVFRRQERVIVEKRGVPVAVLISADDLTRLERLEADWDEPFKVIDRVRAAFADVPDEELEREVDKAVAEARAELRAERRLAAKKV
jgi:prevent-host-death family protein